MCFVFFVSSAYSDTTCIGFSNSIADSKLTDEQKALVKEGGCRALVDLLNDNDFGLQNIEFGPSNDPTHVGKYLGRDLFGSQMILSQEGYSTSSPSVLTARQLSTGSGTLYTPGIQSNGRSVYKLTNIENKILAN